MKFNEMRSESSILHVFPFNSEKKRGGVAVHVVIKPKNFSGIFSCESLDWCFFFSGIFLFVYVLLFFRCILLLLKLLYLVVIIASANHQIRYEITSN